MTNKTIANNIICQLGGAGKLKAMVNGRNFTYDENGTLTFTFSMNKKMNQMKIELNEKDLYNVEFIKYKKGGFTKDYSFKDPEWNVVKKITDLYSDQLKSVFTDVTGLSLSL